MDHLETRFAPSLTETTFTPQNDRSILELISEFKLNSAGSEDNRIAAALALQQIRDRIIAGELGSNVNWREWMRKTLRIGDSERAALIAIADSSDPRSEVKRQRGLKKARQQRYIENIRGVSQETDLPRREALAWLRLTSSENVAKVLRLKMSIEGSRPICKQLHE